MSDHSDVARECPFCGSIDVEQRGEVDSENETIDGKLRYRCNGCLGQFPVDAEADR